MHSSLKKRGVYDLKNATIKMLEYNGWANEKVFEHLFTLPEEIYHTVIKSVFPTIQDALVHVYVIDCGWFDNIQGIANNDLEALGNQVQQLAVNAKRKNMSELLIMYKHLHFEILDYIKNLNDLDENIDVFFGHARFSYSDIISHVVNHGTYHRGNITAMLRQLGFTGCQTDYGLFLFEQRP